MRYRDLPHYLNVQFADARRAHAALCAAEAARKACAGGMHWREVGGVEYLIKNGAGGRRKRLGRRCLQTEALYDAFIAARKAARAEHRRLLEEMKQRQRVNKVLGVGLVPVAWVRLLNGIAAAGLADEVTVIGVGATYAYESAAGVRIDGAPGNAGQTSMLSERARHLQLAVPGSAAAIRLMAVIARVAPSFQTYTGQRYVAADHCLAVEVVFEGNNASSTDDAAAAAGGGDLRWLLGAPRFRQLVVGINGAMASMTTLDPRSYVLHSLTLANQPGRDAHQRDRDTQLARLVMAMVRERIEVSGQPERIFTARGKTWLANSTSISA